ncbi:MAG: glucose transporter subunit [Clostridiaceae bacterium]|jgi:PTS system D-glucosamine-specific IIA component/PTS system glucose-specific IIA component|nr:glucose transporter subunit [Clostridiaceae bacterium]
MFDLFKKTLSFVAPVSGKVIDLSQVPDDAFAQRLVGDGVAIDSTGDIVVSPVDGKIEMIFRTNHAFGIKTSNDIEVLVHIGIDTVDMDGKGFERLAQEGAYVKAGDPIIKVDKSLIEALGKKLITPVLITNTESISNIKCFYKDTVEAGNDTIFTYKLK